MQLLQRKPPHDWILFFACFIPGIHRCPYSRAKSPLKAPGVPESRSGSSWGLCLGGSCFAGGSVPTSARCHLGQQLLLIMKPTPDASGVKEALVLFQCLLARMNLGFGPAAVSVFSSRDQVPTLQAWGLVWKPWSDLEQRNRNKPLCVRSYCPGSAHLRAQPFLTVSASPALAPSAPSVKVKFAVQRNITQREKNPLQNLKISFKKAKNLSPFIIPL